MGQNIYSGPGPTDRSRKPKAHHIKSYAQILDHLGRGKEKPLWSAHISILGLKDVPESEKLVVREELLSRLKRDLANRKP